MPRRIPTHGATQRIARERQYDRDRRATHRFYCTSRWAKLRQAILARDPLCVECLKRDGRATPATEVDHVIPRDMRPDLEFDPDNLQGLCKQCHGAKTARGL